MADGVVPTPPQESFEVPQREATASSGGGDEPPESQGTGKPATFVTENKENTKQTYESCRDKFAQQRLSGTTIIFTAKWAMTVFMAFFAIFLALGVVLYDAASEIVTYDVQYGQDNQEPSNGASTQGEGTSEGPAPWLGRKGVYNLTITKDMVGEINVQYKLSGFYQNHRRYAKSRHWAQLNGEPWLHKQCVTWIRDAKLNLNYPCGLIARSVFNDDFIVFKKTPADNKWSRLVIKEELNDVISEKLKVLDSFSNVLPNDEKVTTPPEAEKAGTTAEPPWASAKLNMWIYKHFPPELCAPVIDNPDTVSVDDLKPLYVVYEDAEKRMPKCDWSKKPYTCHFSTDREKVFQAGEVLTHNSTAAATCEQHRQYAQTILKHGYESKQQEHFGVQHPHFIVWMFVAGYPDFYKSWGKIRAEPNEVTLPKGTELKIYVLDNFQVYSYKGEKYFSITTQNWLGTRSTGLAIAYIITAVTCLISAAYLMFLWLRRRRDHASIPLDFVRPVEDTDAN